ncbi:MAG: hypothetical protein IKL32_03455 [Alphaproteobacteria bacterium]|nr:hypothetical protein [Alphaproteobacteria bacterium]
MINTDDNIKKMKQKVEILINELIIGISCLKILENSKDYLKVFDNTRTAHIVNMITWSLYQSAILNIRKVFEPNKTCSLKKIIKEINANKNLLKNSYKNNKVFNQLLDELNQKWDIFWKDPLTKAIQSGRGSIAHMRELKTEKLPSTEKQMKVAYKLIDILENNVHPLLEEGTSVCYSIEIDEIAYLSECFWKNIYSDNKFRRIR